MQAPTLGHLKEEILNRALFPHCDNRVLHSPGECTLCDEYSDLQAVRLNLGVSFTEHGPDPATDFRPLEIINRWPGNRPWPRGVAEAQPPSPARSRPTSIIEEWFKSLRKNL